jgi:hypothetical protein
VREGDGRSVHAQVPGHQVGDGIGFHFAGSLAQDGPGPLQACDFAVQEHVPDLVGQSGHRLLWCRVRAHADAPVAPGGDRLTFAAVPPVRGETLPSGQMY